MKKIKKMKKVMAAVLLSLSIIGSADAACSSSVHDVKYEPVVVSPGEVIDLRGTKYRIVRVPFVEFGTDTPMYIQFPSRIYADTSGIYSVSTSHTNNSLDCINFNVGGLPAQADISIHESRSVRMHYSKGRENIYRPQEWSINYESTLTGRVSISIVINETALSVSVFYSKEEIELVSKGSSGPNYDLTQEIDTDLMTHDPMAVRNANILFNYISIGLI